MDTELVALVLKVRRTKNAYLAITADGLNLVVDREFTAPAYARLNILRFWGYNNQAYAQAQVVDVEPIVAHAKSVSANGKY